MTDTTINSRRRNAMKCNAYIDPGTGIALEGEALENASKNSDAPRCGYELESGDTFCPLCGARVDISLDGRAQPSNKKLNVKRATRAAFWGSVVAFILTNVLYFALVGGDYDPMGGSLERGIFLKILSYVNLFAYGFYIKTSIRRLHDIERSGWWIVPSVCFTIIATASTIIYAITESNNVVFSILDWVAIIGNLGMVVWLGFAKGTKGPNKYGPDPLADGTVFCNIEPESVEKGEASVGMSESQLDNPKHDGDDQPQSSCAANIEQTPKRRAKSRDFWIILVIACGTVSFIFQYNARKTRNRQYDMVNSMINQSLNLSRSIKPYPSGSITPWKPSLKSPVKLEGMFGVKFGERVPSDVATLTGTDGTLVAFFEPKSPELTFIQYCKVLLPLSRVVCGIQGVTNFPDDEKDKCFETYEKYKEELGRRYGEMTTLRKKMGLSEIDGSEEVCQSIVECDGRRFINLAVQKNIDGKYQLRLVAMDTAMHEKASAEIAQAVAERIPLDGLFGRKLGERVGTSSDETRLPDGSIIQIFEPKERFLDFETYCMILLPQSRTIYGITAVHSCAKESEASECFASTVRHLEKTFKQTIMDVTANFDTAHPDENGEQTLQAAAIVFPNVRLISVQLTKNVNEGIHFVRVIAIDQKIANTLQTEVLQAEKGGDGETEATPPLNDMSAFFWPIERLRRAAEQGDAVGQYNLGNRYFIGLGVEQDKAEAVKWYRKAAEQGHATAQINLGGCYYDGEGVEQDKEEAVKWYRKAAEQGDVIAQIKLGYCYQNGEGVEQDKEEAVKWCRKAAEQGNLYGQEALGNCYRDGSGVKQDMAEAVKWYRKSAEQNDVAAQYNLGVCYDNGEGVEQDKEEAVKWYRKAAANGNEDAKQALKKIGLE